MWRARQRRVGGNDDDDAPDEEGPHDEQDGLDPEWVAAVLNGELALAKAQKLPQNNLVPRRPFVRPNRRAGGQNQVMIAPAVEPEDVPEQGAERRR